MDRISNFREDSEETDGVYLVTGACGFIGSQVARMLIGEGASVLGIDNRNDAYDTRIKDHRLAELSGLEGFQFARGDIEDRDFLASVFSNGKIRAVLNLAARAGVRYSMENPSIYLQTNAQGTLNLLEEMVKNDVGKMVLASTSSLYAGHSLPFSEEMPVNRPLSSYAASKKAAEALCHSFHHLYQTDISVVRYFTVFGPAGRPDMCIFRFIKWIDQGEPIQIYGDGHQKRDFTYVTDIARGTILALRPAGYEIFNLGGGMEPVSLLEVIRMIEELLGKKADLEFHEAHIADLISSRAEIGKAKEMLGWEPRVDFADGLKKTVDWYLENRDWVKEIEL